METIQVNEKPEKIILTFVVCGWRRSLLISGQTLPSTGPLDSLTATGWAWPLFLGLLAVAFSGVTGRLLTLVPQPFQRKGHVYFDWEQVLKRPWDAGQVVTRLIRAVSLNTRDAEGGWGVSAQRDLSFLGSFTHRCFWQPILHSSFFQSNRFRQAAHHHPSSVYSCLD